MRILIVDNNQGSKQIREFFQKHNKIQVTYSSSSSNANFLVKHYNFDGIIINWDLPKIPNGEIIKKEGENFIRKLEQENVFADILVLSEQEVEDKLYPTVKGQIRVKNWQQGEKIFLNFIANILKRKSGI